MLTKKIKVIRPFYYDRKIQAKNSEPELPAIFANELIAAGKAAPIETASDPSEASKADGPKKEGRHAK